MTKAWSEPPCSGEKDVEEEEEEVLSFSFVWMKGKKGKKVPA